MNDENTRELERRLETDRDDLSRHSLTKTRLRKKHGIVAWWPGAMKPHDSGVRTTLAYESVNSVTGERHTETSTGWCVAVAGAGDIFDFAIVARDTTLLDLSTGRWLKMQGRRSSLDFGLVASEQVTTLDAFGRPRSTVRATPRGHDTDRQAQTEAQFGGFYSAFWREQPIYDTEIISGVTTHISAFRNFNNFQPAEGAPAVKIWGLDCNLAGSGGCMPRGHAFDVTGVSVMLFGPDRRPLERSKVEQIASVCTITLNLAMTRITNWPLDLVVLAKDDRPSEDAVIIHDRPAPPVFPFAWPLRLQETEQFQVDVNFPLTAVSVLAPFPFIFVKVILHGFCAASIA